MPAETVHDEKEVHEANENDGYKLKYITFAIHTCKGRADDDSLGDAQVDADAGDDGHEDERGDSVGHERRYEQTEHEDAEHRQPRVVVGQTWALALT
jgi:hypothetical protein